MSQTKSVLDLTPGKITSALPPGVANIKYDGRSLESIADTTDVVVVTREQFEGCRDDLDKASFGMPIDSGNQLASVLVNALVSSIPIASEAWVKQCAARYNFEMPGAGDRLDLDIDNAGMARQTSGAFGSGSPTNDGGQAVFSTTDDYSANFVHVSAAAPDDDDGNEGTATNAVAVPAEIQVPAETCSIADLAPFNAPAAATLDEDHWRVMQCCELDANKNKYYCIELHRHHDPSKAAAGHCALVTRYGRTDDLVDAPLGGRRDIRWFTSKAAAVAGYTSLVHQKHKIKKYLDVDLLSCKIGTAQLQRLVAARREAKRPAAAEQFDPFATTSSEVDDSVLDVVDRLYTEAERALSKAIIAKVTLNGVETPLGAIDQSQAERGLEVLARIEALLTDAGQRPAISTLRALTSELFSIVPQHLGGRQKSVAQSLVIDSRERLIQHREVLQLTIDLISAAKSMPPTIDREPQVMRRLRYKALRCDISAISSGSSEWLRVANFVQDPKTRVTCNVKRIFTIARPSESHARERVSNGVAPETRLLAHGSRTSNWYGILSRGLLLPKQVEKLGVKRTNVGWLGAGIYFADLCCTTTRYAHPSVIDHVTRYVALADVQVGNAFETTKIDTTLTSAPDGFDSVKALGSEQGGPTSSPFQDNEFCIYEPDRHSLSYMVEFTADGTLPPPHMNVVHVDPTPPGKPAAAPPAAPVTLAQVAAKLQPKMPPAFKSFKEPPATPYDSAGPAGPATVKAVGKTTGGKPPTPGWRATVPAGIPLGTTAAAPAGTAPHIGQPSLAAAASSLTSVAAGIGGSLPRPQPVQSSGGSGMVQIPIDEYRRWTSAIDRAAQSLTQVATQLMVLSNGPMAAATATAQPQMDLQQQLRQQLAAQQMQSMRPSQFGGMATAFGTAAMPSPPQAGGFNFGGGAPVPSNPSGGFMFGGAAAQRSHGATFGARSKAPRKTKIARAAKAASSAAASVDPPMSERPWADIEPIPVPGCDSPTDEAFGIAMANTDAENARILEIDEKLRRMFAQDRGDPTIAAESDAARYVSLVDVFGAGAGSFVRSGLTPEEESLPRILEQHTTFPEAAGSASVVPQSQFEQNWSEFTQRQLEGLDWSNVFVAGGCVLACLMTGLAGEKATGGFRGSDVDLFLFGLSDEEAEAKIRHIISVVEKARKKHVDVVRTPHAVTIVGAYPHRHIQIVLRMYLSPAEVLVGFDVDSCSVGFDGRRAWTTPRARRALNRRVNYVNLSRRSLNYEQRLFKYARRGFAVAVPGLRLVMVNYDFVKSHAGKQGLARLLLLDEQERHRVLGQIGTAQAVANVEGPKSARNARGLSARLRARTSREDRRQAKVARKLERMDKAGFVPRTAIGRPRHADWSLKVRGEQGADEAPGDYEHVLLPWGPQWHAWNIMSHLEAKDQAIVYGQQEHRHVVLLGDGVFTGWKHNCRQCDALRRNGGGGDVAAAASGEPTSDRVEGRIRFVRSNPGRQLMTGSFHPVDDASYDEGVYEAGPGVYNLVRPRLYGPGFTAVGAGRRDVSVASPVGSTVPQSLSSTADARGAVSSSVASITLPLQRDPAVFESVTPRPFQELVILVGPPGSGKTTLFKTIFEPAGYVHVNNDTLKSMDQCRARALEALDDGNSVVIDNTNPSKEARLPFTDVARMCGVSKRCLVLTTPVRIAQFNANHREHAGGPAIPPIAYNVFKSKYEAPTAAAEGFDSVDEVPFVCSDESYRATMQRGIPGLRFADTS